MHTRLIFLAGLFLVRAAVAERIWIDTDVSIGSPIREVDDAYALALAFNSPEIRVAGISTSYGNAPLGQTTRVAMDFVRRFGASADVAERAVFPGAESAGSLGRRSAASEALAARLAKEQITYIALGPLTNLATFLQLHPDRAKRIKRVIFIGGQPAGTSLALGPGQSFRVHDANVFKDPAASAAILRSKIPLTLVPIATSARLVIDKSDLRRLEASEMGNYLSRRSGIWLWFWTHFVRADGGPIFDALAIMPAARPEVVFLKTGYASMDERGNMIVTARKTVGARPVRYCTGFRRATKGYVIERLSACQ